MLDKWENGKDKVIGKLKETAGKWMEDDQLEFHGKVQGMKAVIGEKTDDLKDNVLEKTNDLIDKSKIVSEDKKDK
ncbi:MAG: hypothetical protein WCD89_06095 [Anaerocolumna sp.]